MYLYDLYKFVETTNARVSIKIKNKTKPHNKKTTISREIKLNLVFAYGSTKLCFLTKVMK